jgi:uncharacterized protein YggL (DUF469 family)
MERKFIRQCGQTGVQVGERWSRLLCFATAGNCMETRSEVAAKLLGAREAPPGLRAGSKCMGPRHVDH